MNPGFEISNLIWNIDVIVDMGYPITEFVLVCLRVLIQLQTFI